jgi:hypothetical protein
MQWRQKQQKPWNEILGILCFSAICKVQGMQKSEIMQLGFGINASNKSSAGF